MQQVYGDFGIPSSVESGMWETVLYGWLGAIERANAPAAVVDDPYPVANGSDLASTGGAVPPVEPLRPYTEICWEQVGTGAIACFGVDSVFQPGGVWGPAGEWFRTSPNHPPPIDPEYLPTRTVEEAEGEDVAIDWGQVFSGAIDIAQGQYIGGAANPLSPLGFAGAGTTTGGAAPPANGAAMAYAGSCPPRKTRTLTIDCATGQEVKRTRRRRRRLLTSSDLGDLAQLQALVGKGSNAMSVAVSKAIR
jgi:hypothetical protein